MIRVKYNDDLVNWIGENIHCKRRCIDRRIRSKDVGDYGNANIKRSRQNLGWWESLVVYPKNNKKFLWNKMDWCYQLSEGLNISYVFFFSYFPIVKSFISNFFLYKNFKNKLYLMLLWRNGEMLWAAVL